MEKHNTRNEMVREYLHKALDVIVDDLVNKGLLACTRRVVFDVQQAFQIIDGDLPKPEGVTWEKVLVE